MLPITLSKILHDKQLMKRILITIGIVIIYKLMTFIPIPGVDLKSLQMFFDNITRTQGGTLFGIMNMFSGNAMQRFTVLALGLMPYFSSCILIMLLGAVIPFFRKYYVMGGQEGRGKIVRSTYCLTIVLCLIQAFFISLWLENPAHFQGLSLVTSPGWGFRITTVISLTAGVLLLLWLGKLINVYGIGNGVAILVLTGIITKFPFVVYQLITFHIKHALAGDQLFFLLVIFIASIMIVWMISKSTQKIPIIYSNSNIKNSITLRFSWVGKMPIGCAQSIVSFPAMMAAFIPSWNKIAWQMSQGGWGYIISYSILVFFFTYFCVAIVFRPQEIGSKMKKFGCHIENVELEKEVAKYLNTNMTRNTMITAIFLIAVGVLPSIYSKIFSRIPYSAVNFIGGTTLIIIVGVFYDLKCQIEAYFRMREDQNVDKWEIAYIAFDEIEAEIKKGFLGTKEIPCVIEPLRFTWGMPIRTAIDQYRLYVPDTKQREAKVLLD